MASLLVPRATSLLKGNSVPRRSLKSAAAPRNVPQTLKATSRPLTATFRAPLTSSQITTPLLTNKISVRHYSGREARRAQRTQSQTPVRDYEPETTQRGVAPTQNWSVRRLIT